MDKEFMEVEVVGSVFDGENHLKGVVALPKDQAMSLVRSKHAVLITKPKPEIDENVSKEEIRDRDKIFEAESSRARAFGKRRKN